jgi:hypothetical protein
LVTADQATAVRAMQKGLGLLPGTSTPDLPGLGPVARLAPAPAKPEDKAAGAGQGDRPRKDWAAVAKVATPRRKPDGRPARSADRRRAQARRRRTA